MSTQEPSSVPRRPAFLQPQEQPPFWRAPEFGRFLMLAFAALGIAGAFLYFQASQTEIATPPPAASGPGSGALPKTAELTPEQRAERDAYLATAFEGALRDQPNGARIQETTGSRKLLEQVARFEPEEFARRVERPFDYFAAKADPESWRGQYVRASGLLTEIWPEKLARSVAGRETAWRGQMGSGAEFGEPSMLEFLDRPFPGMALDELRRRPVEIEGIFYRMVTFESEFDNADGKTVEAVWEMPWIFVRNIRPLDENKAQAHTFLNDHPSLILGILAFVIFGGRLLIWWIQSRRRVPKRAAHQVQPAHSSIRAMFEQKLREKGIPPAPPSPPKI